MLSTHSYFHITPKLTIQKDVIFTHPVKDALFRVFGRGGGVVPHALFIGASLLSCYVMG